MTVQVSRLEYFVDLLGSEVGSPVFTVGVGRPHVVLVSLQHGDEVLGLDATTQILDESIMQGSLTVIPVANPLGFTEGTRRVCESLDSQSLQQANLNGRHGREDGDRVADVMARKLSLFIEDLQPDFLVDVHAAGCDTIPHIVVDAVSPGRVLTELRRVVSHAALPAYQEAAQSSIPALDHSLSAMWCRRGLAALTLEVGPRGPILAGSASLARNAVRNLLAAVGVVGHDDVVRPLDQEVLALLDDNLGQCMELTYSDRVSGYLRILAAAGEVVDAGEVIAEVMSPVGRKMVPVKAPAAGAPLVWNSEWRVLPGSALGQFICGPT